MLSATHQPSPLSRMGALPLSAEAVFGSGNGIAVSADGRWQMADGDECCGTTTHVRRGFLPFRRHMHGD